MDECFDIEAKGGADSANIFLVELLEDRGLSSIVQATVHRSSSIKRRKS